MAGRGGLDGFLDALGERLGVTTHDEPERRVVPTRRHARITDDMPSVHGQATLPDLSPPDLSGHVASRDAHPSRSDPTEQTSTSG